MNERIKKLKEQATSYTWNGNDVTEELDEQKFAELIVRECAKVCRDQRGEQTIGHGHGGVGHRPGNGAARDVGRVKRERQIVAAVGRTAAVVQPALIGERRALGEGRINSGEQTAKSSRD